MAVKKFLFIRHGKTLGNLEKRYIGNPDEPLCPEGIRETLALRDNRTLPPADALVSGAALRCRQTAELLFPGMNYTVSALSEIDFGIFKGKNADDLLGNKDYEQWLDTLCMGDIPGGDGVSEFKDRCCEIFMRMTTAGGEGTTALVIHRGNIMAILERYARPRQDFYSYHLPNCGFFLCRYENGELIVEEKSQ